MADAGLADNPRAMIGGNNPPETLEEIIARLGEALKERWADLQSKVDAIALRANEWAKKTDNNPKAGGRTIKGPADVETVKQIVFDAKEALRTRNDAHRGEKAPFLAGGRTVDEFFKVFENRLNRIAEYLDGEISAHVRKLIEEERTRQLLEEAKKRAEEERQREIAQKAADEGRAALAAKAEQRAENAAAEADAARAAQARAEEKVASSDAFSGVTGRKTWTFEILDRSKIDLNRLAAHIDLDWIEKALARHAKANKGSVPIDGVRFFETTKNTYRG